MTIKHITAILLGLMLCFCLLTKQTVQTTHLVSDTLTHQVVVAEALDVDDMDAGDELIPSPALVAIPFMMIAMLVLFTHRYSQPTVPTPKRPPSL